MKPKPLILGVAIVATAITGFIAGRSTAPGGGTGGAASPGQAEVTRSANVNRGPGAGAGEIGKARVGKSGVALPKGKSERAAKLEEIVRGEDPLARNRALMAFIDQLGPADFADAVAAFRELGITDARMGEYALLLTAWAEVDPMAALEFAQQNTRNGYARDTILTSWAGKDPEAAIRWAQSSHTGDGANPFLPGIIRGLAALDPTRATQLLASMPRSEERGRGLDYMLPHLLQQGSDATRSWINALPDAALRDGAMMRSAQQLAALDPAGTAKWLVENPGDASRRRIDDVYGTWASTDQQAAIAAYNALPAGEVRGDALRGVVSAVTTENPNEGLALLNRYPNDVNDGVVRDFVWHAFGSDPVMAANQLSRIADPRESRQMYRRVLGEWLERDSAAASAWMQSNAVPDEVRNELLNPQP